MKIENKLLKLIFNELNVNDLKKGDVVKFIVADNYEIIGEVFDVRNNTNSTCLINTIRHLDNEYYFKESHEFIDSKVFSLTEEEINIYKKVISEINVKLVPECIKIYTDCNHGKESLGIVNNGKMLIYYDRFEDFFLVPFEGTINQRYKFEEIDIKNLKVGDLIFQESLMSSSFKDLSNYCIITTDYYDTVYFDDIKIEEMPLSKNKKIYKIVKT